MSSFKDDKTGDQDQERESGLEVRVLVGGGIWATG